jgi:UDP-N-acetylglucosamine 1-carboxyvinyltransferase
MSHFLIRGGKRLSGVHRVPGNKNAALPMLAACLLTDETVALENLPPIDDVRVMCELLALLGVDVSFDEAAHRAVLRADTVKLQRLRRDLCSRIRASILFAGPLLARFGAASIFPPGGDSIGRRRLDTHIDGFRALGATVRGGATYTFRAKRLQGASLLLDEASVTGTENLVMAATLAQGKTTLYNAACEPHVQDLCRMLNAMGARIDGIGTNFLSIEGVEALHGVTHRVGPDLIDAGSFVAAALATGGDLRVEGIEDGIDWEIVGRPFRRLGARWHWQDGALCLPAGQRLRATNDFGDAIPKFEDGPWPAFPSDLMSALVVLATRTRGTMLFFEKMFESRLYFVDRLIAMGAHIVQCDPHRVVVSGPCDLAGTTVASPDIRAGMALLIAALCAKGESVIRNAEVVDRGHARVEEELRALGADIVRI